MKKSYFSYSSQSLRSVLSIMPLCVAVLLLSALMGCSTHKAPEHTTQCKIRTYTNQDLVGYIRSRYPSGSPVRLAIVPFDVPESFAPRGDESKHFGRQLAKQFQLELWRTGEVAITELFNLDTWPGKREEYFSGNYGALKLARNAGYDLVMVGYMEPIKNESDLVVHTKIIDTSQNVTIWHGRTLSRSTARQSRRELDEWKMGFMRGTDQPSKFEFPERIDLLVVCTVNEILEGDSVPGGADEESKKKAQQK